MSRPIIEPFRIKMVEPIGMTDAPQRRRLLAGVHYNLFGLHAEHVTIDLLTDSGTGAMSADQWAAMMRGDESYAGARSYFRFHDVVEKLTGMPFVVPTHQGRAAERILFEALDVEGKLVVSNGLFDTTRANVEANGGIGVDIPSPELEDAAADVPFKGDIDLHKLDDLIEKRGSEIALVVMTVTNNTGGGHAVSLHNLRQVSERCKRKKITLFLDACRFAENAFRVRHDEPSERDRPLPEIAREMFDLCDGFTMSAKKDAIVNIGGVLGARDPALAERIRIDLIRTEGFPTYGGLAGRDLEAIAQGLEEVLDEHYLAYRFAASSYLANALSRGGWPIVRPAAAHAVYIDAGAALPHLRPDDLPGQSVACALYLAGGIRTCEIGNLMFGSGNHPQQLVRLAIPRRVYTQSHIDYVGAVGVDVAAVRDRLPAMRIVQQPPALRHFTAAMEPAHPFPDL